MDASPTTRRYTWHARTDRTAGPAAPPVAGERGAPRPLPPGPYELRLVNPRTRWPGGEIIGFDGADVVLPPGRRAALVVRGRVGASALAAMLTGFLDYQGTATLNDVQLRDLAGEDVRKVIGFCARDARLLDGTVAENVRSARPDATDDDVVGALRLAGVALPPDARVGEGEPTAPCVERQRIALARALLADLPVLVLDEPDVAAGEETTDTVLADLIDAAKDRTLLVIMHRELVPGAAPILRHVDEILTLGRTRAWSSLQVSG